MRGLGWVCVMKVNSPRLSERSEGILETETGMQQTYQKTRQTRYRVQNFFQNFLITSMNIEVSSNLNSCAL